MLNLVSSMQKISGPATTQRYFMLLNLSPLSELIFRYAMHGFVAYFFLSAMNSVRFPSRFALDSVSDKLILLMLFSGVKSVFSPMTGVKSRSILV